MSKIPVGILGATGTVGQRLFSLLHKHPYFQVVFLAASKNSAGKNYGKLLREKNASTSLPKEIDEFQVFYVEDFDEAKDCRFVFSAVDSDTAKKLEPEYAKRGKFVISNASAYRMHKNVPLLIPEVNPEHLDQIPLQQKEMGFPENGGILCKPNCSLQSYLPPLFPLHLAFGLKELIVHTMQAVSGAGYQSLEESGVEKTVVPYISNEEEKSEDEPLKILGDSNISISAHCNRVPVLDGHMACVSARFEEKPDLDKVLDLWKEFRGRPQKLQLPSAPEKVFQYFTDNDRPQPLLDRDFENGMGISIGRLRPCNVMDLRFVCLSHNTLRGAAGGSVLSAELLCHHLKLLP